MKKASTYYFLILAVVNMYLGRGTACFTSLTLDAYEAHIGPLHAFPKAWLTQKAIAFPWWPYGLMLASMTFFAISVLSGLKSDHLTPVAFLLAITASLLMLATGLGYIIPLIGI